MEKNNKAKNVFRVLKKKKQTQKMWNKADKNI